MSQSRREQAQALMKLCIRFDQLVRSAEIYPDDHPALDSSLEAVAEMISEAMVGRTVLRFGPAGSRFVVDGVAVPMSRGMSGPMEHVVGWLNARQLGGFELRAAIGTTSLIRAVRVLHSALESGNLGPDDLNAALRDEGVRALRVTPLRDTDGTDDPGLVPLRLYLRGLRAVERMHTRGLSPSMMVELSALAADLHGFVARSPAQAWVLTAPRTMAPYALRHPVHNALLAVLLGQQMGLTEAVLVEIAVATLCADAGKGTLEPGLRRLPSRLSPDARAEYGRHPAHAVDQLLRLPALDASLRRRVLVAFEQDLADDHSGAPEVLYWGDRHPLSRLVGFVSAWDQHRAAAGPGVPAREILPAFRDATLTHHPALLFDHLQLLVQRVEVAA